MPWFRFLIRGANFLDSEGKVLLGFRTTRFVEAPDPGLAKKAVLNLLKSELQPRQNLTTNQVVQPTIYFEEIHGIAPRLVPNPQPELTWYSMNSEQPLESKF